MKLLASISAVANLLAALWLYSQDTVDTAIAGGLALYFVACAAFMGGLLWHLAELREKEQEKEPRAPRIMAPKRPK